MGNLNQNIESHYYKSNLYEDILNSLGALDVDLINVKRSDINGVDEFHVRGAEVSKELANSINLNYASVLDVGCGLGGPCRMLADVYNCKTTGIDLSTEYIRTATKLSKLVKLDSKTNFIQGDATELPFKNQSFDVVWTQHVQMNIQDKISFYSEINRVLKVGGHFLFYDILKKGTEQVTYPMPWAATPDLSFLSDLENMKAILNNFNFKELQCTDQTQKGIDFFESMFLNLKANTPSKIGLNILMGETTKPKLMNLFNHLKNGNLELKSGVFKKQ